METHEGDNPSKYGRSTPNLVNRQTSTKDTVINVNGIEIGAKEIVVIAGPCAVENYTRNTLDLSAVPVLKRQTHLPVIVDPSHGTGHSWLVPAMAKAAIAVGADGIMVEVHNKPLEALSDGQQSLYPEEFVQLVKDIDKIAQAVGRRLFLHKSLLA